ncbi:MAG: AEC family transporter [Thermodesulfobacteriota bacterium]
MVLDSLFPVFALIVLGSVLKRSKLTNEVFLKTSDRLVYFILFPAMLFWKIGGAEPDKLTDWGYCQAAALALMVICLAALAGIKLFKITDFQAGSFSQSCYRFNTYIGMAVALNAAGEEGARYFGILAGVLIPVINLVAVSTLIWYSGRDINTRGRLRLTITAVISNPLIIACVLGLLYARFVGNFPVFLDNLLSLTSMATLPLALISVGAALSFDKLQGHVRASLIAAVFKLLLFPLVGYFFLRLLGVGGVPFLVTMIFFALPTSASIYILSSQLNSDTGLASASIVISTLLSFISLSVVLLL